MHKPIRLTVAPLDGKPGGAVDRITVTISTLNFFTFDGGTFGGDFALHLYGPFGDPNYAREVLGNLQADVGAALALLTVAAEARA